MSESENQSQRRTILILEDDPLARDMLSEMLSQDYRVLTAGSVSEAERALETDKGTGTGGADEDGPVDLILMDLHLDEAFTAFEAMEYLRNKGLDLPVVMITAQGDEETAVQALKKGFADYLPKSKATLNRDLLISKLETALELHRLQRENDMLIDMIEESQQRLFSVYDSLDDVIMQIDRDCTVRSVNRAGAAYADSEPREIVGRKCWEIFDFYPCEQRDKKEQCHIWRTFLEGETNEGERTGSESGRSYQYMTFITTHRGGEYVVYRETDVTAKRGIESKLDAALRAVLTPPLNPRRLSTEGEAETESDDEDVGDQD